MHLETKCLVMGKWPQLLGLPREGATPTSDMHRNFRFAELFRNHWFYAIFSELFWFMGNGFIGDESISKQGKLICS
jgi:hypothetical protein